MAVIRPRNLIFGAILVTLMIVGGVNMMDSMNNHPDSLLADSDKYASFNESFNKFDELDESISGLAGGLDETNPSDPNDDSFLGNLIKGSWNTLKTIGTSFSFIGDMFDATTTYFGVPAWIPALIGSLILIIFIFGVWSAVFQREL